MAIDIVSVDSGNPIINNGAVIIGQHGSPYYQYVDDPNPAVHTPTITTIQSKYDARFDDKSYYVT